VDSREGLLCRPEVGNPEANTEVLAEIL
jgi:hypothetical protein